MKKINNNELYSLLQVVKNNGNIKKLTRIGLTFQDIIENIKFLSKEKKLDSIDGKIQLTEEGEKLFSELSIKYKNTNKDKWIEEELESKLDKLDSNFIYLPNQNKLYF